MSIQLVAATDDDLDYVWRLYATSFRDELAGKIKGGWVDDVERKKFQTICDIASIRLIKLEDKTVGWLSYSDEGKVRVIDVACLEEEHRGQGIDRQILDTLRADAGDKMLVANVLDTPRHRKYLTELGFRLDPATPAAVKANPLTVRMSLAD